MREDGLLLDGHQSISGQFRNLGTRKLDQDRVRVRLRDDPALHKALELLSSAGSVVVQRSMIGIAKTDALDIGLLLQ
jgi:hypothetical protein